MKRFRFSLDRLLDVRKARLREVEIRYGAAMSAVTAIDRRIAEMNETREAHKEKLAHLATGRLAREEALAVRQFIDRTWLAMLRAHKERKEAEEAAAVVRDELMEARRAVRVLEILRERRLIEWKYQAGREEDRELDDIRTHPLTEHLFSGTADTDRGTRA